MPEAWGVGVEKYPGFLPIPLHDHLPQTRPLRKPEGRACHRCATWVSNWDLPTCRPWGTKAQKPLGAWQE